MNATHPTPPLPIPRPDPLPDWFARAECLALRVMTASSVLVVLVGLVLALLPSGDGGSARRLALIGVGIMLATPVVRLLLLGVAFLRVRDRLFALLVLVVLAVIVTSFALG